MPEALVKQSLAPADRRPFAPPPKRANSLYPALVPVPDIAEPPASNDDASLALLAIGERVTFEIPQRIWTAMFACYAAFFGLLILATGEGGRAIFAIVVSVLYAVVYFGVARLLARQAGVQPRSPLDGPQRVLQTCYGPMKEGAVAAQILVVPFALVLFALGMTIVVLAVGP